MPRSTAARTLVLLPCLLGFAWLAGFAGFVNRAGQPGAPPPEADGIVALTGGADRVETAARLLEDGRAGKLLISGVPPATGLSELDRHLGTDLSRHAAQVTLGRRAVSTYGNGAEAAEWARDNDLHSIIVVTAAYHMPRALTELGRAMPEVKLYPMAVVPRPREGTNDSGSLGMLAGEYTKWIAASLGLGVWSRGHGG